MNIIHKSTTATVAAVAVTAGLTSYMHAVTVAQANGETSFLAHLYPLTIDGLVFAASMSLLSSARRKQEGSVLAKRLFWSGIAVSVLFNLAAGFGHGLGAELVAAWPALALVGSFELLMRMIRDAGERQAANADPLMVSARTAFPEARAGSMPTLASIKRTLQISDARARTVRDYLTNR